MRHSTVRHTLWRKGDQDFMPVQVPSHEARRQGNRASHPRPDPAGPSAGPSPQLRQVRLLLEAAVSTLHLEKETMTRKATRLIQRVSADPEPESEPWGVPKVNSTATGY